MTTYLARLPWSLTTALGVVAVAMLASSPAGAQGTDEQREACAPDAIKLCSDVIPDVPKTTACMRRHHAQLSARCRVVFDAAVPAGTNGVASREPGVPATPPASNSEVAGAGPERVPGLRSYEDHIRDICRRGMVDAFTCRNTLDLLKAGE